VALELKLFEENVQQLLVRFLVSLLDPLLQFVDL